jgi:hypothetical protein
MVVLLPLALQLMGCRAKPAQWSELGRDRDGFDTQTTREPRSVGNGALLRFEPVTGSEVAQLSADDVIKICIRIGLTKEQIMALGPDLRAALYESGAARFLVRGNVEALLRVQSGNVWISSATNGDHVYSLSSGRFRFE